MRIATAVAVALLVLAADRTQRGVSPPRDVAPAPGEEIVRVQQDSARDYDPQGDGREHRGEARNVNDGDGGTLWSTETYRTALTDQKQGVGIIVDAVPGVAATGLELRTQTPGWSGAVYGAAREVPRNLPSEGWRRLGTIDGAERRQRVELATQGRRLRHYLVWITALPPGRESVTINEISLFRVQNR